MENKFNLYSYADSMKNEIHSRTIWKSIKVSYFYKSIALVLFLPVDLFIYIYLVIVRKKFDCIFATDKWPDLICAIKNKENVAIVSSPNRIFFCYINGISYIPASIFYLVASVGVWLPRAARDSWSLFAVRFTSLLLAPLFDKRSSLVVHSDALPFGRALVISSNELEKTTLCIQHGSFREYNIVLEQDGFLCDHNIVRSEEDKRIIARSSYLTKFHVIPDFFQIKINKKNNGVTPRVLLLGEGYHIMDKKLNISYLELLRHLYGELDGMGLNVAFRPHPSERKIYRKYKFKNVDLEPLVDSLEKTNAIIGYSSTLLQEAAEINIPAFYVDPLNKKHVISGRNNASVEKLKDVNQVYMAAHKNMCSIYDANFETAKTRATNLVLSLIFEHL